MSKVITYQAPSGQIIDLTRAQISMLGAVCRWPRTAGGEEYCTVSHGLHVGEPSMPDADLLRACGVEGLSNDARYWDLRRTYGDYSREVMLYLRALA